MTNSISSRIICVKHIEIYVKYAYTAPLWYIICITLNLWKGPEEHNK